MDRGRDKLCDQMDNPIKHPGWPAILHALKKKGVTQTNIEAKTGISQNFISDLFLNKRTSLKFESGVKLYAMYAEIVLRKKIALLPIKTSGRLMRKAA